MDESPTFLHRLPLYHPSLPPALPRQEDWAASNSLWVEVYVPHSTSAVIHGDKPQLFFMLLGWSRAVIQLLSKSFLSCEVVPFPVLWLEKAELLWAFDFSIFFALSLLPAFSFPCLMYMK